jgi:tetratricopeptide (TPR) repeat protein
MIGPYSERSVPTMRGAGDGTCMRHANAQEPLLTRTSSLLFVAVNLTIACLTVAACGGDGGDRRDRHIASGDQYSERGNHEAAVIEYLNAVQRDGRSATARLRLAEGYARVGNIAGALQQYQEAAALLPDDEDLQNKMAALQLAAGDTDGARARAERVLQKNPDNVDAHIVLGRALAGLRDFEAAVRQIEEAISLSPSSAEGYTSLGVVEYARGALPEAGAALERAVELDPSSVRARLALASYHWTAGRLVETERVLEQALAIDGAHSLSNRAMAGFLVSVGRAEEALPHLRVLESTAQTTHSRLTAASYYMAAGHTAEAVTLLNQLSADSSVGGQATVLLGRIALAEGRGGEALKLAEHVLQREPKSFDALLLKGEALAADRRLGEALQAVRLALQVDSRSVDARFALGRLHEARNELRQAAEAFGEVLRLAPDSLPVKVELARVQLQLGNAVQALELAREAVRQRPDLPAPRLVMVSALVASRDLPRASAELEELRKSFPDVPAVHLQIGRVARLRQEPERARRAYQQALALDPASIEALSGLTALDLEGSRFDEAMSRLAPRLAKNPEDATLIVLASSVHFSAGRAREAEGLLRRAIELDPSSLEAYSSLARLYLQQGRLADARKEFETLARHHARPVGPLTMVGILLLADGDVAAARGRFEEALAIDPRAAIAANNLAWLYAESDERMDRAHRLAQIAYEQLPDVPEVSHTLGWILYKRGLASLAIPPLQRSAEKRPDNATYQFHLGLAYAAAKDLTRARHALERALSIQTNFSGADHARTMLASIAAQDGR